MSVPAALPRTPGVTIHGTRYPLVLPSVRDPRLHLAVVIVSLQVLGQVAFDFRLSIAQILISVGTCALLEIAIVFRRQRMLVWPASALLTGNGVAFILRVPGTEHGDWWSMNGWWIFAGTAAVSLLSKYVIRFRGAHVFNPSNFGLVLCFLLLGPDSADPLDFWWGPMSPALALALAIIVVGGFLILSRLGLLAMALSFWLVFVAAVASSPRRGTAMTARWHLGPVDGLHFWTVLAFSPEILVFLFFMLTDPKTVPAGQRARVAFAVSVALLAAILVASRADGVLGQGRGARRARGRLRGPAAGRDRAVVPAWHSRSPSALGSGSSRTPAALVVAGMHTRPDAAVAGRSRRSTGSRRSSSEPSQGVDSKLDRQTARRIAADLQKRRPAWRATPGHRLARGGIDDQFPAIMRPARGNGARPDDGRGRADREADYRIARVRDLRIGAVGVLAPRPIPGRARLARDGRPLPSTDSTRRIRADM